MKEGNLVPLRSRTGSTDWSSWLRVHQGVKKNGFQSTRNRTGGGVREKERGADPRRMTKELERRVRGKQHRHLQHLQHLQEEWH